MKPLLPTLLLATLTACGTSTTASPGAGSPGDDPIDLAGGDTAVTPATCSDDLPMLCPGAETPTWQLADFQPKSSKS